MDLLPSWTDSYTLKWNDCTATGAASLEAMCGFFQESAWLHADHLGVGFQKLKDSDQAWVLARITMHIDRYPHWRETFAVKTWPTGIEKIFARRDFMFLDSQGRTMGSGSSWWVIIDPKTRQPQVPESVRDLSFIPRLEHFNLDRLRLPKEMKPSGFHEVEYLETDQLNHVNNTRYAAWILNMLGKEWNSRHVITSYQIEFMAEAFANDKISLFSETLADSASVIISGTRESDGKEIFRAKAGWR